jgi:hypothetical protein
MRLGTTTFRKISTWTSKSSLRLLINSKAIKSKSNNTQMSKLITILVMAMYTLFMGMFLIGELIERKNK